MLSRRNSYLILSPCVHVYHETTAASQHHASVDGGEYGRRRHRHSCKAGLEREGRATIDSVVECTLDTLDTCSGVRLTS